jgi:DNA-binding beta-propeller fold protein YncE
LFNTPVGLAIDVTNGYVYVADSGNNAVLRVSTASPYEVQTVVSSSYLKTPFGLAIDDGYLYVTSFWGHNIFQFDLTQYAGTAFPATSTDVYAGSTIGKQLVVC